MSGRKLVIAASKLAACAGMHPFKARADMVQEFTRKYAPHRASAGYVSAEMAARRALAALPPEKRARVEGAIQTARTATSSSEVMALVPCDADLPPEVVALAQSEMSTAFGTRNEDRARSAFGAASGARVVKDDVYTECRAPWFSMGDVDVFLGGMHDGITERPDGTRAIVEVKSRMRRMLGVPTYERVQVHAYMHIFGVDSAVLVESFGGEEREHAVDMDAAFWDGVRERATEFVADVLGP